MTVSNHTQTAKPKQTKRQKRKLGPNPSNTWPQQPKIKSEAARNKAYLANAGFTTNSNSQQNARGQKSEQTQTTTTTNNRRKAQPLDPEMDVLNSPEFKFGRLLASPDARIRHSTILKLQAYLQARCAPFSPMLTTTKAVDSSNSDGSGSRKRRRKNADGEKCDDDSDDNDESAEDDEKNDKSVTTADNGGHFRGLSELDLLKLWKGLWHTLYLCDGVSVQEEVSKVLAKLMWSLAGSEEQDEYAGRLYLEVDDEDGSVEWDGDEGGDGVEDEKDQMSKKKMIREDAIAIIVDQDVDKLGTDSDSQDSSSSASEGDDNQDDDELQEDYNDKHCRGAHLSQLFIRTYFQTLTREWYKMDKYRIDKFYTLTRLILRETYRYMAARHWNLGIIRLFNDALFEEVLRPTSILGGGGGNGVRFHLLDICLEELALVNAEGVTGLKLTEATFLDCLEPFFEMLVKAQDKLVHDRVMEKVVSRFLTEFSVVSDNYNDAADDDDAKLQDEDEDMVSNAMLVMDEVHVGSVAQFIFELASDSKTLDRYRKELYDMHKTYKRRIKEVGRDIPLDEKEEDEFCGTCEEGAEIKDKNMDDENMTQALEENDTTSLREAPKAKKVKKQKEKATLKENKEEVGMIEVLKENEDTPSKETSKVKKAKKQKAKVTKKEEKKDICKPNEEKAEDTLIASSPKDSEEEVQKESDKSISSKKEKRKKRKKKNAGKKVVKELPDEKDDVITITVDEQNKAADAATNVEVAETKKKDIPKRTSRQKEDEIVVNNDIVLETPKKVKFRKMNTSKSYKASMKDLKKIDHKAERTPEKSILMKQIHGEESGLGDTQRSSSKKSGSSKKKRKKNKILS